MVVGSNGNLLVLPLDRGDGCEKAAGSGPLHAVRSAGGLLLPTLGEALGADVVSVSESRARGAIGVGEVLSCWPACFSGSESLDLFLVTKDGELLRVVVRADQIVAKLDVDEESYCESAADSELTCDDGEYAGQAAVEVTQEMSHEKKASREEEEEEACQEVSSEEHELTVEVSREDDGEIMFEPLTEISRIDNDVTYDAAADVTADVTANVSACVVENVNETTTVHEQLTTTEATATADTVESREAMILKQRMLERQVEEMRAEMLNMQKVMVRLLGVVKATHVSNAAASAK